MCEFGTFFPSIFTAFQQKNLINKNESKSFHTF